MLKIWPTDSIDDAQSCKKNLFIYFFLNEDESHFRLGSCGVLHWQCWVYVWLPMILKIKLETVWYRRWLDLQVVRGQQKQQKWWEQCVAPQEDTIKQYRTPVKALFLFFSHDCRLIKCIQNTHNKIPKYISWHMHMTCKIFPNSKPKEYLIVLYWKILIL